MAAQHRVRGIALFQWLTGFWAAVMVFFTFGVAARLFETLPRAEAGRITTLLFPSYFGACLAAGLASLAAGWSLRRSGRPARAALALLAAAVIALAAIPAVIQPAMAGLTLPEDRAAFGRLHGISMVLNLFSLLAVPAASLLAGYPYHSQRKHDAGFPERRG